MRLVRFLFQHGVTVTPEMSVNLVDYLPTEPKINLATPEYPGLYFTAYSEDVADLSEDDIAGIQAVWDTIEEDPECMSF